MNRGLSQLPETIAGVLEGMIIELPSLPLADGTVPDTHVAVVPVDYSPGNRCDRDEYTKFHRNEGWWTCTVVASTNPSYCVGGHKIAVPTAQLARGRRIDLTDALH